jgi:hypothetical protein
LSRYLPKKGSKMKRNHICAIALIVIISLLLPACDVGDEAVITTESGTQTQTSSVTSVSVTENSDEVTEPADQTSHILTDNIVIDYGDLSFKDDFAAYRGLMIDYNDSDIMNVFPNLSNPIISNYPNITYTDFTVPDDVWVAHKNPFGFVYYTKNGNIYETYAQDLNSYGKTDIDDLDFNFDETHDTAVEALAHLGITGKLQLDHAYVVTKADFETFRQDQLATLDPATAIFKEQTEQLIETLKVIESKDYVTFDFTPDIDGIPVSLVGLGDPVESTSYASGNTIRITCSTDGIEGLYISYTIKPIEKLDTAVKYNTLESAEQLLKEKYESIIVPNEIHITGVDLVYAYVLDDLTDYTNANVTIYPMWRFSTTAIAANEQLLNIYFNAVTGEVYTESGSGNVF